jgi:hypothetical protein
MSNKLYYYLTFVAILAGLLNVHSNTVASSPSISPDIAIARVSLQEAPHTRLIPTSGQVGDIVTLSGGGFAPAQLLTFRVDGTILYVYQTGWDGKTQVMTDPKGEFGWATGVSSSAIACSVRFILPVLKEGEHRVSVEDESGNNAIAILTVLPKVMLSALESEAGSAIKVTGTGLESNQPVTVTMEKVSFPAVTSHTNSDGVLDTTIIIPQTHKGMYGILVTEGKTPWQFDFIVEGPAPLTPSLVSPPENAAIGNKISFSWGNIDDPSGITYEYQASIDFSFIKTLLDKKGLISAEYQLTPDDTSVLAENGRAFYWRVKAVDGIGQNSEWTATRVFKLQEKYLSWGWYAAGGILLALLLSVLWLRRR